jgi:hypothetical protein
MADFAIVSPKLGQFEKVSKILLNSAFLADESTNVQEWKGEYHKLKGRLPEIYDADYATIIVPKYTYPITGVNTGTKTFTILGDYAAIIASNVYTGSKIRINSSTGNDKLYTLVSATYSAPNTNVIVTETIASAAVDGNLFVGYEPVLKIHLHVKQLTSAEYILFATAYHIWLWTSTDKTLAVKFTCGTPASVTRWEIVTHNDNVYATNNVDKVLKWDVHESTGNDFVASGDLVSGIKVDGTNYITKAKHIFSHEGYLFLGYVTYATNDIFPQSIFWSDYGTDTFDQTGAGDTGQKDFNSTPDFLMGFGKWNNYIVVFKEEYHHVGQLVTEDDVFAWEEQPIKVGTISADSIVNNKEGQLFWIASDLTIREIRSTVEISKPVFDTLRIINPEYAEYIQSIYIDEYNKIYWAIPTGASETNNKIISHDVETGNEFIYDIPVRAFAKFKRQERYTYESLRVYGNYANWGAAWLIYDAGKNKIGYPVELASDYAGNVYTLHSATNDAGAAFTGDIVLHTTLTDSMSLNLYKRVNNGATFIFNRKSTGTVTVSIKRDTSTTWEELGTITLISADGEDVLFQFLPFDKRFKTAKFKISSPDEMELIGILFNDFEMDDER